MPYEWKLSQRIGCLPSNRLTEHHNPPESYVDRTENSLQTRYSNHKSSFSKANKCHNTELGKYIWYLKENLTKFKVKWRTLQHTASSNRTSNRCNLCLWEKYFIICKPDLASLNKRNELISSCRHTSKYALENFTPKVLFLFLLLCFVLFSYTFSCHAIHTQFFENVATVARAFQLNQPAKVNSRSVILSDEFKTPVVLYQT